MIKTFLIYNSTSDKRFEKIRELAPLNFKFDSNPDLLIIERQKEKKSIGIEEVKILGQFLSYKPLSNKLKIAIISGASYLTTEAQNSILKTLEEHSNSSLIFLEDNFISDLLPTIISRCALIKLDSKQEFSNPINLPDNFFELSKTEKLNLLESSSKKSKEEWVESLNFLLTLKEKNKYSKDKIKNTKNIHLVSETMENLNNYNLNTRLTIEYLFLNLEVIEPEKS